MQPDLTTRKALVIGGTGTVGSAVLRELASRGVSARFTYGTNDLAAKTLAAELHHSPILVDLADPVALRAMLDAQRTPDLVICCAGVTASQPLVELDVAAWQHAVAVNVTAPLVVCRWLAERRGSHREPNSERAPIESLGSAEARSAATRRGEWIDVVIVGGLDRTQSLPLPVGYAATQGALSAMVMALGHELGPVGIRINMVSLGVLEGGTSRDLASRRRREYETFSSLRRIGTAAEAAKAIAWLALENTYIQGKVVPINGGI